MQMSETLAKLQNLQDVLGEKYAIKSNVDELPKTLNGSRESLERFKKEYIEKNTEYEINIHCLKNKHYLCVCIVIVTNN